MLLDRRKNHNSDFEHRFDLIFNEDIFHMIGTGLKTSLSFINLSSLESLTT